MSQIPELVKELGIAITAEKYMDMLGESYTKKMELDDITKMVLEVRDRVLKKKHNRKITRKGSLDR